eukprot:TRINITY_DN16925_c0_g1_i1.p1 TRINITY_DN16925_c0_g1~~TRINITY_DN16925_c0_g1_i1.p1  ORF type:complete len:484 (-),score=137.74 TRINITY_DN16925_c0_g1_i1:38-1489(-)
MIRPLLLCLLLALVYANATPEDPLVWLAGVAKPPPSTTHLTFRCFTADDATVVVKPGSKANTFDATVSFTAVPIDKKKKSCFEPILLTIPEQFSANIMVFPGRYDYGFEGISNTTVDFINKKGITIYNVNDHYLDDVWEITEVLNLFTKSEQNLQNNMSFMKEKIGMKFDERFGNYIPDLPKDYIQPGDALTVASFMGINTVMFWVTGGRSEHAAIFLNINETLCVVESSNSPGRDGTVITPWEQWWTDRIQTGNPMAMQVSLLKLSPEARARFDHDKAIASLDTFKDEPYGSEAMFYSAIDTPNSNLPEPFNADVMTQLLAILHGMVPPIVDSLVSKGLNKRMGNEALDWDYSRCVMEAEKRGMTVMEVMAIPERDEWTYQGRRSIVCSTLVSTIHKEAGVYGDIDLNAKEFNPKDIYQIDVWDKSERPKECHMAGDDLPFCQLYGKYIHYLPGWSSVPIYAHMNDRCPSTPVDDYFRPDNC